jgi:serine/threonine protein kinase
MPPGTEVLPGYRVVRLLTHGHRLDTYDAYDEERGCRVVVKVLREDRRSDDRVREGVLQEAALVTELAHPHLVRGYEAFEEPPAMVLETLTGSTLSRLVEQGPLAPADVALLGTQLASVLGYLHRKDWLHLDVKPANVVVRGGIAVLIDLSLAGRPGEGRPGAGTRGYLAPEQAVGRGLSPATDVWGLGVTLLEALTGELPYGDEATWDSKRRWPLVHRRLPERPFGDALPDGVPAEWRDLLLACVDRDPAARPRLADVTAVLGGWRGPSAGEEADEAVEPIAG